MQDSIRYTSKIHAFKLIVINSINQVVKPLLLPDLDYVELPNRIRLTNNMGEELDDYIMAVREGEAILNTMFNETNPKLISLDVEILIKVLKQVELYKQTEY